MNEFGTPSQLIAMEDRIARRRNRTGRMLLALALMPTLLVVSVVGFYLFDTQRPVVVDFRVLTQFDSSREVVIDGTMNKVRDCELVEIVARTTQREVTSIDFLDLGAKHPYSRPLGPQKFGPWAIVARRGDGVTLYTRHRCNPLWTVSGEMGSFVAGQQ